MKLRTLTSSRISLPLALAIAAMVAAPSASALTYYWDSNGTTAGFGSTDGTWGTSTFWSTNIAGTVAGANTTMTIADDVNFGTAANAYTGIVTLNGNKSVRSMTFGGTGAVSLVGDTAARTLTLGPGGITMASGAGAVTLGNGTATKNVLFSLATGQQTWTNNSSNNLTINNTASTFTRTSGATLVFNQASSGIFSMSTTVLPNSNGIVGPWAFFGTGANMRYAVNNSGTIAAYSGGTSATDAEAFTSATTNYDFSTTGTTTLTDNRTANTIRYTGTGNVIDLGASGTNTLTLNGILAVGSSGTLTIQRTGGTGTLTAGSTNELVIAGTQNVTISAPFSGSGKSLTYNSTGTLTLSAANTHTGSTSVGGGSTLVLMDQNALQSSLLNVNNSSIVFDSSVSGNAFTVGGLASSFAGAGYDIALQNNAATPAAIALTVNSSTNSTYTGVLSGPGSLTKSGTGTLTLNGVNTFTGGTVINGGTLNLARLTNPLGTGPITVNGATFGPNSSTLPNAITLNGATISNGNSFSFTSSGLITLSATSTFDTSTSGNMTFTGNASGVGGVIKNGSSQAPVRFNGTNNTFAGPITVNAGTLQFQSSLYGNDTAQWTPANITVASGATLMINVGGASDFTLTQADTLFGNLTTVNNNGLKSGSSIGLDISNAGATPVTISSTLVDSTGTGGGVVGLKIYGSSGKTLELTGANNYSGPTSIDNDAILKVSSLNSVATNVSLGTVHSASSSLGAPTTVANGTISLGTGRSFKGATLLYTGTGETTDRVLNMGGGGNETYRLDQSGSGLLKFISNMTMTDTRGPKTIVLQGSTDGAGEMAGVIPNATSSTQTTAVTKSGTGTWTLSGANLFVGVTTVSSGALVLANSEALKGGIGATGGAGALTFNGGVIGLGAGDFFRPLAAANTAGAATFTGAGGWAAYGANRAVNLGGASAAITWATASTGLNGQTLILGNATATHTVDFQNPLNLGTATRTVQVDNGAAAIDGKLSGILSGGAGGNLTKTGLGTLEITNNGSSYSGNTNVNQGKLVITGNISTSPLTTVASGATIGGEGTVGALTISSGGFVTPGNSPGVLTVNGNYIQAGTYTAEITGTTPGSGIGGHDQIDVTGTVNITGGSLTALFSGTYAANDMIFILLNDDTDAITGTYAGFAQDAVVANYGGFDWKISYEANGDSLGSPSFTGGNDIALRAIPEPRAALLGGLGLLALLRRRRTA